MHNIALSADEVQLLKNHFQLSPIALIRIKAQALLMRNHGLSQEEIAEFVIRDVRSIQRYIEDFAKQRLASLFSGHVDNENASKLTRQQKQEIKATLQKTPEVNGLPKEFWDVPRLKKYVKAEFGVVYESNVSYHFLLKYSGLSFKYPDKLSPRRDELQIINQITAVRKEIQPLLKDRNWIVLASDETRIQLEAEIRRAWLAKGKRTIVTTERSSIHQNYLGFLDQRSGVCQIFNIQRGNQKETIRVLKQLVKKYPNQRICIVWDNAKWHKGKLLREQLKRGRALERIHLINFPPYAPECNPIEHVWQYGKSKIANRSNKDFEAIQTNFIGLINARKFDYKI